MTIRFNTPMTVHAQIKDILSNQLDTEVNNVNFTVSTLQGDETFLFNVRYEKGMQNLMIEVMQRDSISNRYQVIDKNHYSVEFMRNWGDDTQLMSVKGTTAHYDINHSQSLLMEASRYW